jgi:precorrin-3B C17-methyltransferase
MTQRALEAIQESDLIIGYKTYLDLIQDLLPGKETISRGMLQEIERARLAVEKALEGRRVGLVSSGDPGVYAMASVVLEYLRDNGIEMEVEIVPGITAATVAAAALGSPLGHDFAVISLSDLLTPWEAIERRLRAAGEGDFVVVLYNPKSKERTWQIERAAEILSRFREKETPVGIVRKASREGESVRITTLGEMCGAEIDMLTVVIIGNTQSFVHAGRIVTPRGYRLKYAMREGEP